MIYCKGYLGKALGGWATHLANRTLMSADRLPWIEYRVVNIMGPSPCAWGYLASRK